MKESQEGEEWLVAGHHLPMTIKRKLNAGTGNRHPDHMWYDHCCELLSYCGAKSGPLISAATLGLMPCTVEDPNPWLRLSL